MYDAPSFLFFFGESGVKTTRMMIMILIDGGLRDKIGAIYFP